MTGTVLELVGDIISPDQQATELARQYVMYTNWRTPWLVKMEEIARYVYATDTSGTSAGSLPWKNRTTIPKMCQIFDNLLSNYMLTLFPKENSIFWLADNKDSSSVLKRNAIQNRANHWIMQPSFKAELFKAVVDYILKGNAILTVEWRDDRTMQKNNTQMGYVGPGLRRLSPIDVVPNPVADDFIKSPKFIRTIMSLGEFKEHLQRLSNDENREAYQALFDYTREIRNRAVSVTAEWNERDGLYMMDGFGTFQQYLQSNTVEVLTFYGDWYDAENDILHKNRVITFVDRHKIVSDKPNASFFGYPPIFHCAWRRRPDNIYGMGPLENLAGMQYKIDSNENKKADILDLTAYPVQKIKGFVEDYNWEPGAKIFVSDEGDVELLQPNINIQQLVQEIAVYQQMMEEMAGAPREAMGFRSPGEKTKYEVQTLENAASRIFQSKINQFEEFVLEPALNAMLELDRRNMVNSFTIPVNDQDYGIQIFQELTVDDITGVGRIVPRGARHFAEQTQMIQNLQGLAQSPVWQYVQPHFSSVEMAKMYNEIFDLEDYNIFTPYINISEQAEAQRQAQTMQEQLHQEMGTASGLGGDYDVHPQQQQMEAQAMQGQLPQ